MAKNQVTETNTEELKGALRLRKPYTIDGKVMEELPYDFEALTAQDIIEADKDRAGKSSALIVVHQFDATAQLCVFAKAVEKVAPNIALEDIMRMGGRDAQAAMTLGRRFFTVDSEDGEDETTETPLPN